MPSIRMQTNHSTSESLNRKPVMAITGTKAASQSEGRRPRRCVMAEAKGVMANTPSQPVATNTPGQRGGHAVALEPEQQQRHEHEVAHQLEKGGAEDGHQAEPGLRRHERGRRGAGEGLAVLGRQRVLAHALASSTAFATSAKPAPRSPCATKRGWWLSAAQKRATLATPTLCGKWPNMRASLVESPT